MDTAKFDMRCPWCGHDTMHYGEEKKIRDEVRSDLFSCRGCGAVYDSDEIQEIVDEYLAALAAVRKTKGG